MSENKPTQTAILSDSITLGAIPNSSPAMANTKADIPQTEGKDDFVLRSLSKIAHKRWEHFVINRVHHVLNDPEIEFVCQQAFRRKSEKKPYLADLFFPQFGLYLEIDEPQHATSEHKQADVERSRDIIDATNFREIRIKIYEGNGNDARIRPLTEIVPDVDKFVADLRKNKAELVERNEFKPWDYERQFKADLHIENGKIAVGASAVFRTHKEALRCFGYTKGHFQRGGWRIPSETVRAMGEQGEWQVWFPKLYKYKNWKNSLSDDGKTIEEQCTKPDDGGYREKFDRRIVMAHRRDALNHILYRFLGVFKPEREYREGLHHRFRLDTGSVNLPARK